MAETWIIKDNASGEFATTQIAFTSNGQKFTSIGAVYDGSVFSLQYGNNEIAIFTPGASSGYEFDNQAYRKLTFDTPPTGALLTWLQANATRQVVEYLTTDKDLIKVANAIRAKSGTTAKLSFPDGFVQAIDSIPAGGGGETPASAKWNDVTFIDYDGSVLYSYSLAKAQALTELPALPSHNGLVCQGWNWTLEAIKALNRPVTVGAMYITDNGATRIHIRIATVGRMTVPLYIGQTVANGVSIDWGDESAAETLAGTGEVNTSHTYAEPGDYIISLMPQDGCTLSFGNKSTENTDDVYYNMLQDVSIGKNVTSIGNAAFQTCYSLASITIPAGVTSIGDSAFSTCYSLASIAIPAEVTSIGNSAFYDCYSLASITIPDSVTSIGNRTFSNCYSIASITIPDGVTSIGHFVFDGCYSLASIAIPDSVTSIGDRTFSNCSSLASITIPAGVTSIDSSVFDGCYSLASITIPDGVTSIGSSAFSSCRSLASITIPAGVTSIGSSAFYGCTSLASVTIPAGVTSIDNSTFARCFSLASITIPAGVTSIGNNAFQLCYGMRYYDFSACTAIPTLSNTNAFKNIPSDCQMLIPSALYDEWSTATNWATYSSKMVSV